MRQSMRLAIELARRAPTPRPRLRASPRSIQPKPINVSAAQTSPRIASHPMCQMRAKPVMTAKNAVTNPLALLRGTSIDS